MAIYKGREVTILGKQGGEDTSPLYTILHKDNSREDVQLNQLMLTKEELKDNRTGVQAHLDGANIIEDKDLQDLRDKQDRQKIEAEQKKHPQDKDVTVSKIKVPAEELKKAK